MSPDSPQSRGGKAPRRPYATAHSDVEAYSDDESEFIAAMDAYRRKTGVKFPSLVDTLNVLLSLGYRKERPESCGSKSP